MRLYNISIRFQQASLTADYFHYHVLATTAIKAIEKAYRQCAKDVRYYDEGEMVVVRLERVEGKIVK